MRVLDGSKSSIISIHALLAESDKRAEHHASSQQEFLSTLSLRRATWRHWPNWCVVVDFYPRSPCGERHLRPDIQTGRRHFYPRSPCGERLPHGGSTGTSKVISIHALLAESDTDATFKALLDDTFLSTLSLRRATTLADGFTPYAEFLSTLSLRRATVRRQHLTPGPWHFYPRSPCGERLSSRVNSHRKIVFLSTLSLRRATVCARLYITLSRNFYPRSPCGERRTKDGNNLPTIYFYPRSPCGERRNAGAAGTAPTYFYPRSPCGERRQSMYHSTKF